MVEVKQKISNKINFSHIYLLDLAQVNYFYRHSWIPDSGFPFRIPVLFGVLFGSLTTETSNKRGLTFSSGAQTAWHAESGKNYFASKSTVLLLEVKNVSVVKYLRFLLQPTEILKSMLKLLLVNSYGSLRRESEPRAEPLRTGM